LLGYLIAYLVSSALDRLFRPFTNIMALAFMNKDQTGTGAARTQNPDEMSTSH
jgi:hypothetical protein